MDYKESEPMKITVSVILGVIIIITFGLTGTLLLLVSSPITIVDVIVDILIIPGIGLIFGIYIVIQNYKKIHLFMKSI